MDKRNFDKAKSEAERRQNEWPVITIAGHKFHQIPRGTLEESFKDLPGVEFEAGDPDELVLLPYHSADDHLEFPARPTVQLAGMLASAGIARHTVLSIEDEFDKGSEGEVEQVDAFKRRHIIEWSPDGKIETSPEQAEVPFPAGFCARQIRPFNEDDWFGECWQVLKEHKWWHSTQRLTPELEANLEKLVPGIIAEAKNTYGENWGCYAVEVAAMHLCSPLSRLWYAANMMALRYCHFDDLRLGYLWSEYQARLRWENAALKQEENAERNREVGKLGGELQAARRRERYAVLDRLAMLRMNDILVASDMKKRINIARQLAAEHASRSGDVDLFRHGGKALRGDWYEAWTLHFLRKISDIIGQEPVAKRALLKEPSAK